MSSVVVNGIVLSGEPAGERDKRIFLLTEELGRVRVFVKGGQRPENKSFAAALEFSSGEYKLFSGKGFYSLADSETTRAHLPEWTPETASLAAYFSRALASTIQPGDICAAEAELLREALSAMKDGGDLGIIKSVFLHKLFFILGISSSAGICPFCGGALKLKDGETALCAECRRSLPVLGVKAVNYIGNHSPRESFSKMQNATDKVADLLAASAAERLRDNPEIKG